MDVVRDLFNVRDQQCIFNTKPDVNSAVDRLYWSNEVSGIYSVKSAYRLLQKRKELWSVDSNDSIWSKVLWVKTPPKVLNLMWCAMSNCLPT